MFERRHTTTLIDVEPLIPYSLFERQFKREIKQKVINQVDDGTKKGQAIRCRFCHATITYPGNQIERLGKHIHSFSNPSGLQFTIACYSRAWCMPQGEPTAEWSWFPGYRWQYALCHQCQAHLGWFYQATSATMFYGLILNRLTFDEET